MLEINEACYGVSMCVFDGIKHFKSVVLHTNETKRPKVQRTHIYRVTSRLGLRVIVFSRVKEIFSRSKLSVNVKFR